MGPPSSGRASLGAGLWMLLPGKPHATWRTRNILRPWRRCRRASEPTPAQTPGPGWRVQSPAPDLRGQGMGAFSERGPELSWAGRRGARGPEQSAGKQRLNCLDVSSVQPCVTPRLADSVQEKGADAVSKRAELPGRRRGGRCGTGRGDSLLPRARRSRSPLCL